MKFETMNSVYEVDKETNRIRRIEGENEPTGSFQADGKWQVYEQLKSGNAIGPIPIIDNAEDGIVEGKNLFIYWGSRKQPPHTITSPIQNIIDPSWGESPV